MISMGLLTRLPRDFRYSVEIRNDDFLDAAYFDVLRSNRVAHIFTSWSRMPSLRQQLLIEEAFTAPFTAARALLRPGRAYEQAVEMFSPLYRSERTVPFRTPGVAGPYRPRTGARYLRLHSRQ